MIKKLIMKFMSKPTAQKGASRTNKIITRPLSKPTSSVTIDFTEPAVPEFKQAIVMCLGRAHGQNVAGKGSPAFLVPNAYSDDDNLAFREFQFSEDVIDRICELFNKAGIRYVRYIADNDFNEPGLSLRQKMINSANAAIVQEGMIMISHEHHVNAAGPGDKWLNATGVAIYTSKGQTKSDLIATDWFNFMKATFTDLSFRSDFTDKDPDYEAGFYNLVTAPPAILTEWLFQDNKKDVEWMLKDENRDRYAQAYFDWFVQLNQKFLDKKI